MGEFSHMKIAVLVKTALDTGQLRVRDTVVVEETPLKISDIDRNAVEEAVKLKGQGQAYGVTVLKWGPLQKRVQEAENVLREALAMAVVYMALAEGVSRITTPELTLHLQTNMYIVERFLPVKFRVEKLGQRHLIEVNGVGRRR